MAARISTGRAVDASAVALSGLCLAHCLALPLIISVLPATLQGLQSELVHQVLVVFAVPLALTAAWAVRGAKSGLAIQAVLLAGALGLILGAFVEPLHDYETLLTVLGAILLSVGHIFRWFSHAPSQS